MAIEPNYRNVGEQIIASYNYTDIANGTGVTIFSGFKHSSGYAFSQYAKYSQNTTSTDGVYTIIAASSSITFELQPFNLPKTITGQIIFNYIIARSAAGTMVLKAKIYKDATLIQTIDLADPGSSAFGEMVVIADLTTTHYKKAEQFKIKIENTGTGDVAFYHDPQDSSPTEPASFPALPSKSKFTIDLPFKLDL